MGVVCVPEAILEKLEPMQMQILQPYGFSEKWALIRYHKWLILTYFNFCSRPLCTRKEQAEFSS